MYCNISLQKKMVFELTEIINSTLTVNINALNINNLLILTLAKSSCETTKIPLVEI